MNFFPSENILIFLALCLLQVYTDNKNYNILPFYSSFTLTTSADAYNKIWSLCCATYIRVKFLSVRERLLGATCLYYPLGLWAIKQDPVFKLWAFLVIIPYSFCYICVELKNKIVILPAKMSSLWD